MYSRFCQGNSQEYELDPIHVHKIMPQTKKTSSQLMSMPCVRNQKESEPVCLWGLQTIFLPFMHFSGSHGV